MQVANTGRQNKLGKGVFKAIFMVLAWLIIFSLAKDALHIEQGFNRVKEAKIRLEQEELRNKELAKKYEAVRTDQFKEKLIREQLNMQKEGEVIAVLPKKSGVGSVPKSESAIEIANWRKWLNLVL